MISQDTHDLAAVSRPAFRASRVHGPLCPASILVVDDEDGVRATMQRGLATAGFRVDVAANGNEALARLDTTTYDWVITDIFMPERDGIEVLRLLRREHPRTRVIAMSGGGMNLGTDCLRIAGLLGASHILRKPFLYADLVALLDGEGHGSRQSDRMEDGARPDLAVS
jgi:CheY-like chemotaxis protein